MTKWIAVRSALRRPRSHPVLRPEVRHHEPYVVEANVRRDGFFNVSEPLDSLLQASRLNQRLRVESNPPSHPASPAHSRSDSPPCKTIVETCRVPIRPISSKLRPPFKSRSVCSAGAGSLATALRQSSATPEESPHRTHLPSFRQCPAPASVRRNSPDAGGTTPPACCRAE